MRRIAAVILAGLLVTLAIGGAEAHDERNNPVVVELFTSQGCASCPPADEELSRLAERPDVIALSAHVDYWDYLGWADKFGLPENTTRQRAFAEMMGERMIYTPQMVFQGREHAVGSQRESIESALKREFERPALAHLDLGIKDNAISVTVLPIGDVPMTLQSQILMVTYTSTETVSITRGENRGREMKYSNVVKGWKTIGPWDGCPMQLSIPIPEGVDGAAILIQKGDGGPIIGARRIALK